MTAVVLNLPDRFYDTALDEVDSKAQEALLKLHNSCAFIMSYPKIHEAIHDHLWKTGGCEVSRCVGTRYIENTELGILKVTFNLNIVLCTNRGTTHYLNLRAGCAYLEESKSQTYKHLMKLLDGRKLLRTEHDAECLLRPIVSLQ